MQFGSRPRATMNNAERDWLPTVGSRNVTGLRCNSLWQIEAIHYILTLRRLMSYIYIYIYIYIYGAPILDVSRSHTTTQHGR